jgi:hypothetical protein
MSLPGMVILERYDGSDCVTCKSDLTYIQSRYCGDSGPCARQGKLKLRYT